MTETGERIGDDWHSHAGHTERYLWAAESLKASWVVNDIACGIGYGSTFLIGGAGYHGYDKPDTVSPLFPGCFHAVDLNDPGFAPAEQADLTCCFETLEHVEDPERLAETLKAHTRRLLFVSVPTVPTKHQNPWHLHDFTVKDIERIFVGDGWRRDACRPQPDELAHVWRFKRVDQR